MARGRPRKQRPADSGQQRQTRRTMDTSEVHTVLPNGALQTQFQAHIPGMFSVIAEIMIVLKLLV